MKNMNDDRKFHLFYGLFLYFLHPPFIPLIIPVLAVSSVPKIISSSTASLKELVFPLGLNYFSLEALFFLCSPNNLLFKFSLIDSILKIF